MSEQTVPEIISAMHGAFNHIAGLDCRQISHERTWFELVRAGYSADDVETFLRWVQHENAGREQQYRRVFHIPRMFSDLSNFDADLSLAKAWWRNRRKPTTQKDKALSELRPIVEPSLLTSHTSRSVGAVIETLRPRLG